MVPQVHLGCWTRLRVFKRLGERGMQQCWHGKFSLEDLGTWLFTVKERQYQIFLDNRPLAFERDLCGVHVPVLFQSFGFLGGGQG